MDLSQSTHKTELPSRAWLVVFLLCIVGALNYIDRTMITTMRSSITAAIPMSDAKFGLLTAVFLWVYGILSPFAGFLADRFNRSRVIIISLFVWSAVTWLTAYATTFEQLLATRALMGISEACYIPAALALISDYHKGPTRSLAIGIHMAGIMAGQSLGFIGGWIAEEHDWSAAFSVFGIVGIVYTLIITTSLKDAPQSTNEIHEKSENKINFWKAIAELFSNKSFILLLSFWSLLSVITWLIVGWLPTLYMEHFKLSQAVSGLYATGYLYPASVVGVLLGGFIADRWSKVNFRARILVPMLGLCVAAPAVFLASGTSVVWITIICFILYAITKAFTDSNGMPILCMIVNPKYRATGYGILNFFSCIVGGIGLYAGGALRDSNIDLTSTFRYASLLIVLCIFLLYMIRPKYTTEN